MSKRLYIIGRLEQTLERTALYARIPIWSERLRIVLSVLYEPQTAVRMAVMITARMLTFTGFGFLAAAIAGMLLGDQLVCVSIALLAALYPHLELRRLQAAAKRRNRAIAAELPSFASTVMLLAGAGEPIPRAIVRALEQKLKGDSSAAAHPLYRELILAAAVLRNNAPFPETMESMTRRLAAREASMFTAAVLLQYTRGGEDFIYAMRDLTRTLWERRKASARTAGEETAAKLVFPMIVIFVVVMGVTAAPAILLINR